MITPTCPIWAVCRANVRWGVSGYYLFNVLRKEGRNRRGGKASSYYTNNGKAFLDLFFCFVFNSYALSPKIYKSQKVFSLKPIHKFNFQPFKVIQFTLVSSDFLHSSEDGFQYENAFWDLVTFNMYLLCKVLNCQNNGLELFLLNEQAFLFQNW